MLERSFVHIPGIGFETEKKLWEKGILSWGHLKDSAETLFKQPKREKVLHHVSQSEKALRDRNLHFFYRALPRDHIWRLIPGNDDNIAYLDIETTGMGMPPSCHSTTITIYYKGVVYQEHEHEKKHKLLKKILAECSLICTFFGEVFDVPFLRKEFDLAFDKAHVDLCFWLKRLGFHGGLKKVEKRFPEIPSRAAMDIDGFDAVRLWRMHRKGVEGALETLLHYNAEDTVVLENLMILAFNREVDRNPELSLKKLGLRPAPKLETKVHQEVYNLLRN